MKPVHNNLSGFRVPRAVVSALAASMLVLAAFAGSAQACSSAGAANVFHSWNDQRSYVLAPEGGFEAGAQGWSL